MNKRLFFYFFNQYIPAMYNIIKSYIKGLAKAKVLSYIVPGMQVATD